MVKILLLAVTKLTRVTRDNMAHGLKYYKEIAHTDGKVIRLEILEKAYVGIALEIGPVCQALCLDIQGDTEIDAPIVKTSVTMTFVDAPDHEDSDQKKCGDWEEFYTSDATKWKVVIKVRKEAGLNFVTMWGGYITPDSYNEVLTYRGSVTIVARDNIGHMNDFPFDADGDANGMISMRDVIGGAWAKIESPMSLRLYSDDWMLTNDVVAYDTMMNVSAFEGKSWGEAVEMVLFAYGATLRYVGYNDVAIRPLRWIPQMGAAQGEAMQVHEPKFISGAERELVPAVRRVEENVDYDVEGTVSDKVDVSDFVGSTEDVWILGNESNSGGIVYPIVNKTRGRGWCNPADSLFFNPYPYSFLDGKEEDRGFTWLTCNTAESSFSRYAEYSLYAKPDNINLYCKFGPSYSLGAPERLAPADSLLSCLIAVAVEQNGITSYLTNEGEWVSEPTRLEKDLSESPEFNLPIPLVKYSGAVLLRVLVLQVKTTATYRDAVSYVPLYSLALGCDKPMLEKNGVNTNYNDENNVILSREPKIAPALNDVAFTRFIKNGIFTADGSTFLPTKRWAWPGTTPQQMAVYNHLQLLCYHSKPNNVLRGTIVNADLSDLRVIWLWHGAEHMLVSGSINYLNGHLENAVLREFARYEDMWGMLAPADLPDVEGNSSTNVEGGASSGSKGASITNRTEVYIGGGGGSITLDSYMSDTSENGVMNRVIKAYVDDVRNDLTDLWRLEGGKVVTDKSVTIHDNLVVEGDVASSAPGENNPVGIQGIKLNGQTYTDYDGDGVIDLGEIESGLDTTELLSWLDTNKYIKESNLDTYGVATKSWVEGKSYLTSSALNGYATQSWVNEQGFAKASALSSYQPLSTAINTGNIGNQYVKGLATPVSLWGNSFNGTANITGTLKTPSGYDAVTILDSYLVLGQGLAANNKPTYIDGYNVYLRYGKASTVGLTLNSSGNATIGSSDLAGTSNKLYVDGDSRISGNLIVAGDVASGGAGQETTGYLPLSGGTISNVNYGAFIIKRDGIYNSLMKFSNNNGTLGMFGFNTDGNAIIYNLTDISTAHTLIHTGNIGSYALPLSGGKMTGTIVVGDYTAFGQTGGNFYLGTPVYPLIIRSNGTTSITGNLNVSGTVTQGSDIRFKHRMNDVNLDLDVMANAPLFNFYWNDRNDNQIHIGTSAQYWEIYRNELVSGTDFKGLDYSTLGVAMGISLAKKVKELEAEIKRLKEVA